jgi:glycerophosphoryl diester phosphodiesterase
LKDIDYTAKLIAHRGIYNNKNIPENSLAAFNFALKYKVPIELDLQLSKDNKIVVFHDESLKRMTGIKGRVRDYNYDDLKKFNLLGTSEKIPLFSEVLALVNNKVLLDIEIKKSFNTKMMMNELFKLLDDTKQEYIIKSFDFRYLLWLKHNRKEVIRGLLAGYCRKMPWYYKLFKIFSIYLYGLSLIKPDFIAYDLRNIDYKRLRKLQNKGIKILTWTIRDDQDMKRAIKYKVDGYIVENMWEIK